MKKKLSKSVAVLFAVLVTASVFTSCNRNGYGCPYELNVPTSIVKCIVK